MPGLGSGTGANSRAGTVSFALSSLPCGHSTTASSASWRVTGQPSALDHQVACARWSRLSNTTDTRRVATALAHPHRGGLVEGGRLERVSHGAIVVEHD